MNTYIYKGKNYKVFTIKTTTKTRKVFCEPASYNNNTLAIMVHEIISENETELYAVLTTNLISPFQTDTRAYVDSNNNNWAENFIEKNGLAKATGINTQSGFCLYPLYEFDLNKCYAS